MGLICVIVPVYKVQDYLNRCVDSILNQTFPDFELILVDDGSPDDCGKICDLYAENDKRIRVIHQENKGLSAARNTGIEQALQINECEWITFIDSDDWVHEKYLEALKNNADHFRADLVIGNYEKTSDASPVVYPEKLYGEVIDCREFFINNNVVATVAWGKLYRKELFKDVRYPAGRIHEDEFTTYKLVFAVSRAVFIDQPLYAYFQNPNGIMGVAWSPKRMDVYDAYDEQLDYFRNMPDVQAAQAKRYLINMNAALRRLESNDEYPEYREEIIRRLRKTLRKYKKTVPWKDIPEISERAFPRYMYCYWIITAQLRKIKRLFS